MSYYDDALLRIKYFQIALENGDYKYCVALCCEAADRLLKEKLESINPESDLLTEHEFLEMYKYLQIKYPSTIDITRNLRILRKYFNDSRYSGRYSQLDPSIYTKDFAEDMYNNLMQLKNYIDNDCSDGLQGLSDRFKKKL